MSELEDEGIRTILRRLDKLEEFATTYRERVDHLAANGGCVTFNSRDPETPAPAPGKLLLGQHFHNEVQRLKQRVSDLERPICPACLTKRRVVKDPQWLNLYNCETCGKTDIEGNN